MGACSACSCDRLRSSSLPPHTPCQVTRAGSDTLAGFRHVPWDRENLFLRSVRSRFGPSSMHMESVKDEVVMSVLASRRCSVGTTGSGRVKLVCRGGWRGQGPTSCRADASDTQPTVQEDKPGRPTRHERRSSRRDNKRLQRIEMSTPTKAGGGSQRRCAAGCRLHPAHPSPSAWSCADSHGGS